MGLRERRKFKVNTQLETRVSSYIDDSKGPHLSESRTILNIFSESTEEEGKTQQGVGVSGDTPTPVGPPEYEQRAAIIHRRWWNCPPG